MTERRGPYRTHTDRPFLRATLAASGRKPVSGSVVDMSAGGAGVVLKGAVPPMAVDTEVDVTLESLLLSSPIRVRARVRRWVRAGSEARCAIEFCDRGILERQIPFVLRREFNRRASPRVAVHEVVEVVVSPRSGGAHRLRASLVDLSRDGMRVTADESDALQMTGWKDIHITFSLPQIAGSLSLPAIVRSYDDKDVGVEFEFDPEEVEHDEVAIAIEAFVEQHIDTSPQEKS